MLDGRCSDIAFQAGSAERRAKGGSVEQGFSALYLQANYSDNVEIPSLQFCRVQAASCLKESCWFLAGKVWSTGCCWHFAELLKVLKWGRVVRPPVVVGHWGWPRPRKAWLHEAVTPVSRKVDGTFDYVTWAGTPWVHQHCRCCASWCAWAQVSPSR